MPVLVRPLDGGYEIVSGHNRVEAAKLAGLDKVPVTVRELDDDTATILMLVGGGGLEALISLAYLLFVAACAAAQRAAADWVRRRMGRPDALA